MPSRACVPLYTLSLYGLMASNHVKVHAMAWYEMFSSEFLTSSGGSKLRPLY